MGRHLDFGHDGDVAHGGILHELAQVVAGVISSAGTRVGLLAVTASVGGVPPLFPVGFGTPGGKLGEARVAGYLDAPSGGIGEVEVQTVELVAGHGVNLLFEKLLAAEVARDVNHHSAIFQPRGVFD